MSEVLMEILASILGQERYNLLIDYRSPDGHDAHRIIQVVGARDKHAAAEGARQQLISMGCSPTCIIHLPGDHSIEQLTSLGDGLLNLAWEPLYIEPQGPGKTDVAQNNRKGQ